MEPKNGDQAEQMIGNGSQCRCCWAQGKCDLSHPQNNWTHKWTPDRTLDRNYNLMQRLDINLSVAVPSRTRLGVLHRVIDVVRKFGQFLTIKCWSLTELLTELHWAVEMAIRGWKCNQLDIVLYRTMYNVYG